MQFSARSAKRILWLSCSVLLVAISLNFSSGFVQHNAINAAKTAPQLVNLRFKVDMSEIQQKNSTARPPVYFLSIGGPNMLELFDHEAYRRMGDVGREITTEVRPKAIVVISAHWQPSPSKLQINVGENEDIIYDFSGFPERFYKYQFFSRGSPEVAEKVMSKLQGAGIEVEGVKKGLDHGIWVGLSIAFNAEKNPIDCPIVQLSLFDSEDGDQRYRVGQALESLRDEGIMIIGAGMATHNLYDFKAARAAGKELVTMPYASSFDDAMKEAVGTDSEHRQEEMRVLMQRPDTRKAHPSLEHLLPMYVAAGAAGKDVGERLFTLPDGSVNWAQYRFGSPAKA